jgi:hypothetical protein
MAPAPPAGSAKNPGYSGNDANGDVIGAGLCYSYGTCVVGWFTSDGTTAAVWPARAQAFGAGVLSKQNRALETSVGRWPEASGRDPQRRPGCRKRRKGVRLHQAL